MKRTYFLLAVLLMSSAMFGQNMRRNAQFSLFSDNKAARIGDAVTIIVLESTQASNNTETSAGRSSDIGFTAAGAVGETKIPNADAGLGTKNDFQGSGSTQTTGSIRTKISAVVDTVLANGNMVIRGSRKIIINGEEQIVNIKGVIRQSDINAGNSVFSHNISDAEISFEGSGIIDNAQKPGWLTKLFHWLF
ncbi:MAG: flagellar basal body L-ring protein [Ignavibacteria bacterium]|nr:MAG: flagellar basal body L-ring protein [Ignavibacteria bacterium]KAF0160148.1 MAG: flagellar basal body L-ring protein [Ignavibacteria bacterium]